MQAINNSVDILRLDILQFAIEDINVSAGDLTTVLAHDFSNIALSYQNATDAVSPLHGDFSPEDIGRIVRAFKSGLGRGIPDTINVLINNRAQYEQQHVEQSIVESLESWLQHQKSFAHALLPRVQIERWEDGWEQAMSDVNDALELGVRTFEA